MCPKAHILHRASRPTLAFADPTVPATRMVIVLYIVVAAMTWLTHVQHAYWRELSAIINIPLAT